MPFRGDRDDLDDPACPAAIRHADRRTGLAGRDGADPALSGSRRVPDLVRFSCFRRHRRTRRRAGALLADLQSAHTRLQEYAAQAEELASARERNRLARELHDSVSQAIFSITLTSQSARILLEREPARVPEQVDRLQEMTGQALVQLRSLIAQLRPPQDK